MAEPAGSLINLVLARVRDPAGIGTTRDQVRVGLSIAQRMVNAATDLVVGSATLSTLAYQQVYGIAAYFPNALRITGVQDAGRDLEREEDLSFYDRRWFRRVGSRFESWTTIGRDLLVIHPAKTVGSSVTVFYTALTTDLTQDSTATDLPDFALPVVLDLTELLLYIRARQFGSVQATLMNLGRRLKDQRIADALADIVVPQT